MISVAGAYGLAVSTGRGEHGECLYFEVYLLPTRLKTGHETLATDSEIAPMSWKTCHGLKIFVPQRDRLLAPVPQAGFGIYMAPQSRVCDRSLICSGISAHLLKFFSCILLVTT